MTTKQLLSNTLDVHNSQPCIPRKQSNTLLEIQTTYGQKTVQDEATHSATETRDTSGKWCSMPQVASLCPFWAITRLSLSTKHTLYISLRPAFHPSFMMPYPKPTAYPAMPCNCFLRSRCFLATHSLSLSFTTVQTQQSPESLSSLEACCKMAATYSPAGVQYHRRGRA